MTDPATPTLESSAADPRPALLPTLWDVLLLVLLCLWLAFGYLGRPDFWGGHMESRRAEIARAFMDPGVPWWLPHMAGEPILTKPPLFYWALWGSYRLFGAVSEAAARFPSALAGLLGIAATYWLGRRWRDPLTGLLAAAMLASSPHYMQYWRYAEIDLLFAALITVSLLPLIGGLRAKGGRAAWLGLGLYWIVAGLAFMVKGPYAIIFPLLGLLLWQLAAWWQARRAPVVEPASAPWPGTWRRVWLNPGILVFLLIILPWYLWLLYRVPEASHVLDEETMGRLNEQAPHSEGLFFYVGRSFGFGPWLLLLLPGLAWLWRRAGPWARYLICMWLGSVVFASLLVSKKGAYLLPLFPAQALLAAWLLQELAAGQGPGWLRRWLQWLITGLRWLLPAMLALTYAALWYLQRPASDLVVATLLLAVGGVLVWRLRAAGPLAAAIRLCSLLILIWAMVVQFGMPAYNAQQSLKVFAHEVARRVPASTPLYQFRHDNLGLHFYLQRGLPILASTKALPADPCLLLMQRRDLPYLDKVGSYELLLQNRDLVKFPEERRKMDWLLLAYQPHASPPGPNPTPTPGTPEPAP